MNEVEIPVAHCETCNDTGPVVVDTIDLTEVAGIPSSMPIVYCPTCETILNKDGEVEIKWYSPEDLPEATGWKIVS